MSQSDFANTMLGPVNDQSAAAIASLASRISDDCFVIQHGYQEERPPCASSANELRRLAGEAESLRDALSKLASSMYETLAASERRLQQPAATAGAA